MAPSLSRSAPGNIVHWWNHLKFRLQNKKGWDQVLDETFLYQSKRVNEIPLFYATKRNNVGCIKKLLDCSSTNIFERGALGETALHVAVMNDHLEAAVTLMKGAPELINEPMSSELYQGITALHIAVVNQNVNLVQELILRGADVTTPRATGMYFNKRKGGLLYYGEHILAFASCIGNEEIITMLINAGANIRAQDSLGNTIVHILVLQPNKIISCQIMDMLLAFDAVLDPTVQLDMVPNYSGLTPFKLAAKKGNVVARKILELTPVQQLINLKWNLYGKYYFRLLLLVYLLYIGMFTLCCMHRPLKDIPENYTKAADDPTIMIQKTLKESYVSYTDHLRLSGEIISIVGAIIILLLEIPGILRVGVKRYFGQTALGGPFHVTLVAYAVLVVLLCVLRLTETPGETGLMAVCLVLGWCNVLYFARGFEMLGPYVIVIQKIIFGDLTKFMWLSVIALLGFSTAQWTVYMTQDPLSLPSMRSYPITLFSMFQLSVGLIDMPVDHSILTHPIVFVVFCCFSVVSHLLLLSLLTAMMSDTQWRVAQERDELWRTQVVATTLMLEHRLPRCLWPRLGMCGLDYGLGDRWYLRVEERSDQFMQKVRRYVNVFSKNDYPEKKEESGKNDMTYDLANMKNIRHERSNANRKSVLCWQIVRHSLLGVELENEGHLDAQEMKTI